MIDINKDIFPELFGKYKITNDGKIFSIKRSIILKGSIHKGYYQFIYSGKSYNVHRVVAFSTKEKPIGKDFVNHIDGNKLNNNPNNVEWCTQKENIQHAWKIGLCSSKNRLYAHLGKGRCHPKCKSVIQLSKDGITIAIHDSIQIASQYVKGNPNAISACCNGRCKTSAGYIWRYV